jgi:hypothetical protein
MSPEIAPAAIPEPDPTPNVPNRGTNAPYQPKGSTGFLRAVDRTRNGVESLREKTQAASSRVMQGTDWLDRKMRSALRFRPEHPEQVPFLLPPKGLVYDWGDRVDATAGNAARRTWEIGYSAGSSVRAALGTVLPPAYFVVTKLLSPIRTIMNPLETTVDAVHAVKKSATRATRAVTSGIKTLTNIFINGPTRVVDELVHRGIERPSQRKEDKWYYKPFKIIGGAAGWLAHQPRRATEYITSPIEKADKWLAERQ